MKSKDNKKFDYEQVPRYKTGGATKKGETACVVKRSQKGSKHCGVCGSPDVVWHGATYCDVCKKEKIFLTDDIPYWFDRGSLWPCEHWRTTRYRDMTPEQWKNSGRISVAVCLACGANNSRPCPNCKKRHWSLPEKSKHLCRHCGYTI